MIREICSFFADNNSLQQQLAAVQTNHKEALQSLREREEQVAILERELQDVRQQAVAAQDLAQGLQLENAQYAYQYLLLLCGLEGEDDARIHEPA
jgi:chromosome segregation ATPase